jgi:hypothetical protein
VASTDAQPPELVGWDHDLVIDDDLDDLIERRPSRAERSAAESLAKPPVGIARRNRLGI